MQTEYKTPEGAEVRVELSREDGRLFIAVHGLQIEVTAGQLGARVTITDKNTQLAETEVERSASGEWQAFQN